MSGKLYQVDDGYVRIQKEVSMAMEIMTHSYILQKRVDGEGVSVPVKPDEEQARLHGALCILGSAYQRIENVKLHKKLIKFKKFEFYHKLAKLLHGRSIRYKYNIYLVQLKNFRLVVVM